MQYRALVLTTPTHAMALGIYATQSVLGVLYLTHAVQGNVMEQYGAPLATMWALGLFVAGTSAFLSASRARPGRDPDLALRAEYCAVIALALLSAVYEASLRWPVQMQGLGVYTMGVMVGSAARAWQIGRDRKNLRAARADPHRADPSPLAEPGPKPGG